MEVEESENHSDNKTSFHVQLHDTHLISHVHCKKCNLRAKVHDWPADHLYSMTTTLEVGVQLYFQKPEPDC